jgi:mRNA interferase MazF
MRIAYGQIWMADLSPTVANEQGGYRPVVVVSGARYNKMAIEHAIVAAVTTRDRRLEHHVKLGQETGLPRPSWVMAETLRAVSTTRFDEQVGWVAPDTIDLLAGWVEYFTLP